MFEARAKEGLLLEILEYGVYKILIKNDDELPCIVESKQVSFDETKFIGTPYQFENFDEEYSGSDTWSEESTTAVLDISLSYEGEGESDNHVAINVGDQDSDEHQIGVSMNEPEIDSGNQFETTSSDNNDNTNNADSEGYAQAPSRRTQLMEMRRGIWMKMRVIFRFRHMLCYKSNATLSVIMTDSRLPS